MLIDCEKCEVRNVACGGCVVSVMLAAPAGDGEIVDGERRALALLADEGLIPPLRMSAPNECAS